jgi:hypothetical protein
MNKVGDKCILKSAPKGPVMTVLDVKDHATLRVAWFNKNDDLLQCDLPTSALEAPPKPKPPMKLSDRR